LLYGVKHPRRYKGDVAGLTGQYKPHSFRTVEGWEWLLKDRVSKYFLFIHCRPIQRGGGRRKDHSFFSTLNRKRKCINQKYNPYFVTLSEDRSGFLGLEFPNTVYPLQTYREEMEIKVSQLQEVVEYKVRK
jgi:hypothetical protein